MTSSSGRIAPCCAPSSGSTTRRGSRRRAMTPGSPIWPTTTTALDSRRPPRRDPGRSRAGRTGHTPSRAREPLRGRHHEQRAHLPGLPGEPERAGRPVRLRAERRAGGCARLDPEPDLRRLRRVALEPPAVRPELHARRDHDGADHLDREVLAGPLAGPRRRALDRPLPRRDQGARGARLPVPEHRDRPRPRRRPARGHPRRLLRDRGPDRRLPLVPARGPEPEPVPDRRQPEPREDRTRPGRGDPAPELHRGGSEALRRDRDGPRGLLPRGVRRLRAARAGEAGAARGEPRPAPHLPRRPGGGGVIVQRTATTRARALELLLQRRGLRRLAIALGVAGLVAGSTLWGLYEGMILYKNRTAASLADLLDDVVAARLAIVPNWVSGWLFSDAERLVLDVKHEHFQKLAYQRELALGRGLRLATDDDFVPARIRRQGEPSRRAEIRLKGDWVDHLSGPKWSFRVKLRGEDTLFGMKNFSLQHPKTRRFVYEWVFHQALEREDIIPLRYDFVEVTINGKDLGVYALEEHFDKRLVEHQRRREGPILKFDESLHWRDIAATGEVGDSSTTGMRGMRAAPIDTFGALPPKDDPQYPVVLAATTLLESFRAGELPVAQA